MRPAAPAVQRQESRRAFYAGATAIFGAMLAGLDETQDVTEQDLRKVDAIAHDLRDFVNDLKDGKA